ncbi:MAG: xanthine phosphoribosyltransferase [Clostridia bacterium]|nr:xanthine phosphoribosyltransferase [Clostridia bacterium]
MKLLEERILKDGLVLAGDVLKVDSFLNHQIDVELIAELSKEWKRLYEGEGVNKIVTIEASGIGIACIAAQYFSCPVIFAKKSKSSNIGNDFYTDSVVSYTHGGTYQVVLSKKYLGKDDRVLIIDDFLANGSALRALCNICEKAGATVVGAGIAIEKAYQGGGDMIRKRGIRVESLAKIRSMSDDGTIVFD